MAAARARGEDAHRRLFKEIAVEVHGIAEAGPRLDAKEGRAGAAPQGDVREIVESDLQRRAVGLFEAQGAAGGAKKAQGFVGKQCVVERQYAPACERDRPRLLGKQPARCDDGNLGSLGLSEAHARAAARGAGERPVKAWMQAAGVRHCDVGTIPDLERDLQGVVGEAVFRGEREGEGIDRPRRRVVAGDEADESAS